MIKNPDSLSITRFSILDQANSLGPTVWATIPAGHYVVFASLIPHTIGTGVKTVSVNVDFMIKGVRAGVGGSVLTIAAGLYGAAWTTFATDATDTIRYTTTVVVGGDAAATYDLFITLFKLQ